MFTRISDLFSKPLLVGLLIALAGCGARGPAPKEVKVTVGDTPVVIAASGTHCVDEQSLRQNRAGAFALLDECAALGPVKRGTVPPPGNGLVTVSISPGPIARGEETQSAGLETLRGFLKGPGRIALSRGGDPTKVSVEKSYIRDELLLLKVKDSGATRVPGLSTLYWRGFTQVRGQTASVSVSTFRSSGGGSAETLLRNALMRLREANPALANPNPLSGIKLNPFGGLFKDKAPETPPVPESTG